MDVLGWPSWVEGKLGIFLPIKIYIEMKKMSLKDILNGWFPSHTLWPKNSQLCSQTVAWTCRRLPGMTLCVLKTGSGWRKLTAAFWGTSFELCRKLEALNKGRWKDPMGSFDICEQVCEIWARCFWLFAKRSEPKFWESSSLYISKRPIHLGRHWTEESLLTSCREAVRRVFRLCLWRELDMHVT